MEKFQSNAALWLLWDQGSFAFISNTTDTVVYCCCCFFYFSPFPCFVLPFLTLSGVLEPSLSRLLLSGVLVSSIPHLDAVHCCYNSFGWLTFPPNNSLLSLYSELQARDGATGRMIEWYLKCLLTQCPPPTWPRWSPHC